MLVGNQTTKKRILYSRTLLENFIKSLDGIEGEITKFDEDLWSGLLDYILVKDKEHYTVVFKNGTEVDV